MEKLLKNVVFWYPISYMFKGKFARTGPNAGEGGQVLKYIDDILV